MADNTTKLEQLFMRCDAESSRSLLDFSEGVLCAMAWDALLKNSYGGDVQALLAWWRAQRQAQKNGPCRGEASSVTPARWNVFAAGRLASLSGGAIASLARYTLLTALYQRRKLPESGAVHWPKPISMGVRQRQHLGLVPADHVGACVADDAVE